MALNNYGPGLKQLLKAIRPLGAQSDLDTLRCYIGKVSSEESIFRQNHNIVTVIFVSWDLSLDCLKKNSSFEVKKKSNYISYGEYIPLIAAQPPSDPPNLLPCDATFRIWAASASEIFSSVQG
jgi:hypothetical protein